MYNKYDYSWDALKFDRSLGQEVYKKCACMIIAETPFLFHRIPLAGSIQKYDYSWDVLYVSKNSYARKYIYIYIYINVLLSLRRPYFCIEFPCSEVYNKCNYIWGILHSQNNSYTRTYIQIEIIVETFLSTPPAKFARFLMRLETLNLDFCWHLLFNLLGSWWGLRL